MGGELRKDRVGCVQHCPGTGQIRHVGVVLVRENRVVRHAQFLGALDFSVPVRAFDQSAHQAHLVLACQFGDVGNQLQCPALVSLQGQPQAAPLRVVPGHLGHQRLQHRQGQLQPVDLFGVNREVDVGLGGLLAQSPDAWHEFLHHALALGIFVARVQGTELDADAIVVLGPGRGIGVLGNVVDRVAVALQIAQRILIGACALAQHVVGIAEPPGAFVRAVLMARRLGLLHGLRHGLAQYKLPAQQLHRAQRGGYHGLGA